MAHSLNKLKMVTLLDSAVSVWFGKSVKSFNFDIEPGSENDIFSMKWVISIKVSLILQRALMSTCLTSFWA